MKSIFHLLRFLSLSTLIVGSTAQAGPQELTDAACAGDLKTVQSELAQGSSIEPKAMICAITANRGDMIASFAGHDFDLEAPLTMAGNEPPLQYAIKNKAEAAAAALLDIGANANATSPLGTPLMRALAIRDMPASMIEVLLVHGADPNLESIYSATHPSVTPLQFAARTYVATPEVFELLIRKGAKADQRHSITGQTPLFQALDLSSFAQLPAEYVERQIAKIRMLVATGLDLYTFDANGSLAFTTGMLNAVALDALLKAGIDITRADAHGENVLFHLWCDSSVDRALSAGVSPDPISIQSGRNVLHWFMRACRMSYPEHVAMFNLVLAQGPDLNLQDYEGLTPMMSAVDRGMGYFENVTWLLQMGADPAPRDHKGRTILHHMVLQTHRPSDLIPALDQLHAKGAGFDEGYDGVTALMIAVERTELASRDRVELVEALVKRGASLNIRNYSGKTACDLTADPLVSAALIRLGGCN